MKGKILIVDDDPAIVSAIETVLALEDYTTITAFNGKDSLLTARAEKPQLILLDYMLPDMTGKDVIDVIRGEEGLSGIPIILVSAAYGLKVLSADFPIQAVIEKPFEFSLLIATVAQFIGVTKNTPV